MEELKFIGDYRIIREISRSSIASVYEGHQDSLDRQVLIKRLHPQLAGDPEIRGRFEREAHALARIKHKNIVHIYDFKAGPDSVHLVTEWISGGSLADRIRDEGPLDESEGLAVAVEVLEGLSIAHQIGIIHRDIKPSNLLIGTTGSIKITDFGLAQFEGASSLTLQGMVIGTPAYIAPEIVSGGNSDARCDLYSFGVSLYELMTGINPFQADNVSETLNRVLSMKPDPLSGISVEFNRALAQLMEKRPDRRIPSAVEALAVFRKLASDRGVQRGWADLHPNGSERMRKETAEGEVRNSSSVIRPRPQPKRRRQLVMGLVIVAVVAVLGIPFLTRNHQAPLNLQDTTATKTGENGAAIDTIRTPPSVQAPVVSSSQRETSTDTISRGVQDRSGLKKAARQDSVKPDTPSDLVLNKSKSESIPGANSSTSEKSQKALSPVPPPEVPRPRGNGYLLLTIEPWANIFLGDRFIAQTPYLQPLKLPAGDVTLTLINPDLPPINRVFTIPAKDTLRTRVDLMALVGVIDFIDADPWADVYLDGQLLGQTPIYKKQFLAFGKHKVRFVYVSKNLEKEVEVDLKPGEPPKSVRVSFNE